MFLEIQNAVPFCCYMSGCYVNNSPRDEGSSYSVIFMNEQ